MPVNPGNSPEQNLALARLAATAKQTPGTLFSSELAKAVSAGGKSDTHGPQITTSVNSVTRAGVYAPASIGTSMPAPQTTSASHSAGARKQQKRRQSSATIGKKS